MSTDSIQRDLQNAVRTALNNGWWLSALADATHVPYSTLHGIAERDTANMSGQTIDALWAFFADGAEIRIPQAPKRDLALGGRPREAK